MSVQYVQIIKHSIFLMYVMSILTRQTIIIVFCCVGELIIIYRIILFRSHKFNTCARFNIEYIIIRGAGLKPIPECSL